MNKLKDKLNFALNILQNKDNPLYIQNIVSCLFVAFLAVTSFFMMTSDRSFTDVRYTAEVSLGFFLIITVALGVIFLLLCFFVRSETIIPILFVPTLTLFCYLVSEKFTQNIWLSSGLAIFIYLCCLWLFNRFDMPLAKIKINFLVVKVIVCAMFVLSTLYMSISLSMRYYSFGYSATDFGIFAQMFDYMKDTGLPNTTVERNQLLSHFAVHFSPFFYVLLPAYFIFSTPAYLLTVQALFIAVGVFAVYGIAKALGFSEKATLLVCALYTFYPSLTVGQYYDFHESKFLTFCILFAFYFLVKRQFIGFYIFGILLCTIKEDAAIYLVAIALYMIVREKLIKHGIITLVIAICYFIFAISMVESFNFGSNQMQFGARYSNFAINGDNGIGSILTTVVVNFGYTLKEMFIKPQNEVFTQEKLLFVLWMFVPVLLTPFRNSKISTLLLLSPMLLINLMPCWGYQYDIEYQYTYGTAAMVIICTILALKEMNAKQRNMFLTVSVVLCFAITMPITVTKNSGYIKQYFGNREVYSESVELIRNTIDKSCAVGTEGDVTPMLYDYKIVYYDPHTDERASKIEYNVTRTSDEHISEMESRGFVRVAGNSFIEIYKNPNFKR